MATKPIPFGPILDDSGALVAGATVTIASVKDVTGTNIASHGATLNDDGTGLRVSVNYDAAAKGEAWITLAVSRVGSTFTGIGAAPTMFAAADSFTLDSVQAKTVNLPADPASNTQVNTRLATSGYTAPDNTSVTAIKAKTDNLPSDPADASDIAASFGTVNSTLGTIASYIDTEVAAILGATD